MFGVPPSRTRIPRCDKTTPGLGGWSDMALPTESQPNDSVVRIARIRGRRYKNTYAAQKKCGSIPLSVATGLGMFHPADQAGTTTAMSDYPPSGVDSIGLCNLSARPPPLSHSGCRSARTWTGTRQGKRQFARFGSAQKQRPPRAPTLGGQECRQHLSTTTLPGFVKA